MPLLTRFPGRFPAGKVLNGIVSHADWFPTLLAIAGDADIKERLKAGAELDGRKYKVRSLGVLGCVGCGCVGCGCGCVGVGVGVGVGVC